jgi:hypothetical protein
VPIPRTTKFYLTHFAIWIALFLALLALPRFARGPIADFMRSFGWYGLIIHFVILSLAPFGVGPLGKQLSNAVKKDERDSWRRSR